MAIICMFFPAVLMCYIRDCILMRPLVSGSKRIIYYIGEYAKCCMELNLFLFLFLAIFRGNITEIYYKLDQSSIFAIKYLLLSIILAIVGPLVEKHIRERFTLTLKIGFCSPLVHPQMQTFLVILYAAIAALLHFIRIFNNSFWCDEGLAINVIYMTWDEMLQYVAKMGHAPFHYVLLWGVCKLITPFGFLYHFISVIPYLIILTVAVTIVFRWFGKGTAIVLITLSTFLETAVTYNLEVRAYSWCQLFLLLLFLISYQTFKNGRVKYYIYMCFFSLGAVYSHYFALASIGIIYVFLLIFLIMNRVKEIWKLILSGCGVLTGVSPWLLYCYQIQGEVMHNYELSEVSWQDCLSLYSSRPIQSPFW